MRTVSREQLDSFFGVSDKGEHLRRCLVSNPNRFYRTHGPRVLIFNQQSQRDALHLLPILHTSLVDEDVLQFHHVIFCTNLTYKDGSEKIGMGLPTQRPQSLTNPRLRQSK
jgi:hypothetical protein